MPLKWNNFLYLIHKFQYSYRFDKVGEILQEHFNQENHKKFISFCVSYHKCTVHFINQGWLQLNLYVPCQLSFISDSTAYKKINYWDLESVSNDDSNLLFQ